jgi:hypothetical protein
MLKIFAISLDRKRLKIFRGWKFRVKNGAVAMGHAPRKETTFDIITTSQLTFSFET